MLKQKVDVSGEMLRNAQVSVQNNEPYVSLSFDATGTKAFADLTANNIGKRLAIVLGSRELPVRLVVWSTEPDEKAEKEWEEQRKKIQERDPEDVPAVRTRPLPREPLHTAQPGQVSARRGHESHPDTRENSSGRCSASAMIVMPPSECPATAAGRPPTTTDAAKCGSTEPSGRPAASVVVVFAASVVIVIS